MTARVAKAITATEHENKYSEYLHLEIAGELVAPESKGCFPSRKKSEPGLIAR